MAMAMIKMVDMAIMRAVARWPCPVGSGRERERCVCHSCDSRLLFRLSLVSQHALAFLWMWENGGAAGWHAGNTTRWHGCGSHAWNTTNMWPLIFKTQHKSLMITSLKRILEYNRHDFIQEALQTFIIIKHEVSATSGPWRCFKTWNSVWFIWNSSIFYG